MQPSTGSPDISPDMVGLLAETRAALTHLRADELEALASRAEAILANSRDLNPASTELCREHRLLGDLLTVTGDNLRVLRRVHGNGEGSSRWAR